LQKDAKNSIYFVLSRKILFFMAFCLKMLGFAPNMNKL